MNNKKVLFVVFLLVAWVSMSGFFGSSVDPIRAGNKVGIVLMHGKGGTTRWVDSLASALQSAGALVAKPDMPWHKNRIYDKTFDDSMAEVHEHVAALRAEGAEQVFVAGHSLGAVAAAGYAARYDDISGIVLLAPGHFVSAYGFSGKLANDVKNARIMIEAGKAKEKASFGDINAGKRKTRNVTAEIYYSWFSPNGPADFVSNMAKLNDGIAVLYIAGAKDKIPHTKEKGYAFLNAPPTVHNTFETVNSRHLDVPSDAKKIVAKWLDDVTSFDAEAAAVDLVKQLESNNKQQRKAAANKLGLLSVSASAALIDALNSSSSDVRETAATLLGEIKAPDAVDALIKALNDSDSEVRWSVVTALEEIGDPRAAKPLQALRNDADEDVREAVDDALKALKGG